MSVLSPKYRAVFGFFFAIGFFFSPAARSCGDFHKPETHFNGVNEFGFVSYWDQIGEIKLADRTVLPLIIGFRSDWETLAPSPHLGGGWLLALLDSHFVQKSENAFDMISIDGYTVPFGRDAKNPSILNGAQGWKAEIKGDAISVWAECGWRLQFTKGKISSITTPKNSLIQIRRDESGFVNDVISGAEIILKLQRDSNNVLTLLLNNGKSITMGLIDKPLIQLVNGVNVIGAKNLAVGFILKSDGSSAKFDYTPSGALTPQMTITDRGSLYRLFSWDPATRRIISDGEWKYDITPSSVAGLNAKISRTNLVGQRELWHYDQLAGSEVFLSADGSQESRFVFNTGILAGKLRKRVLKDKNSEITISPSYSEAGDLLRTITYRKFSMQTEGSIIEKISVMITDNNNNPQLIYSP